LPAPMLPAIKIIRLVIRLLRDRRVGLLKLS
jgi:hypothetical protein